MKKAALLQRLGWSDPFDDFQPQIGSPYWTWHHDRSFLEAVYAQYPEPQLIVEVGSWLGYSAIEAARYYALKGKRDFTLICIDTWLGSLQHWIASPSSEMAQALQRQNGYPQCYHSFLSNISLSGFADFILPLPQNSANGARILQHHQLQADWVYLDASHESEDIALDLQLYWPLVRQGGFLIGDDWSWPSVRHAVIDFCDQRGLSLIWSTKSWGIHRKT